ncbi:hypothetical protein ACHAW5_002018 [Stephanodiscus triporus]|uniref:Uncharacterized protein n=1 Tax=Stephanodiscus triporus TaxID=2934178 RepID=A0ABD3MSE5_9STRA
MIKFYPIVVAILGFALPGGGTPSVIAALGVSGSPSYGGISPTKLEDGGRTTSPPRGGFFLVPAPKPQEFSFSVWGWKGWTAESIELHPDAHGRRDAIHSTVEDDISKEKIARLTTILGFHTTEHSSKGMLAKICARDVMEGVPKYLRALYTALEDTTDPLDMVQRARTFLNALCAKRGWRSSGPALGEVVVVGGRGREGGGRGRGGIAPAKRITPSSRLSNIGAVASMLSVGSLSRGRRRRLSVLRRNRCNRRREAAKRGETAARKANEDRRLDRQQNMRERENPHRIRDEDGRNHRNLLGTPRDYVTGAHDVCHKMAQEPVYLDAHVLQVLPQAPLGEVL